MKKVLVVGATGGIGRALHQAIEGSLGTTQNPSPESDLVTLDVVLPYTYPVFDDKFDEIYFCTGMTGRAPDHIVMEVNATGAISCLAHLANYVVDGGSIRIMSSINASLAYAVTAPSLDAPAVYRMSKVALNIGVIRLHHKFDKINWQLIHPGFVKTRMTEKIAHDPKYHVLTPEEAAQRIIQTPVDRRLSFVNTATGKDIPW